MDVGVRDTQELMYRLRAILSTANIAMPNTNLAFHLRVFRCTAALHAFFQRI